MNALNYLVYILYRAQYQKRGNSGIRERYTRGMLVIQGVALTAPVYAVLLCWLGCIYVHNVGPNNTKLLWAVTANIFLASFALGVVTGFLIRAYYRVERLKMLQSEYGATTISLWKAHLIFIPAVPLPVISLLSTMSLIDWLMQP